MLGMLMKEMGGRAFLHKKLKYYKCGIIILLAISLFQQIKQNCMLNSILTNKIS